MEGRRSAAVAMVQQCAVLDQDVDDRHLGNRIPGAAGTSPRVARVMERSGRAAVFHVRVRAGFEEDPGDSRSQSRGGEMERCVADVEPVRDGVDEDIQADLGLAGLGSGPQNSDDLLLTIQNRFEDWLQ